MESPPSRPPASEAMRTLVRAGLVAAISLAAACKDMPTPPIEVPFTSAELGSYLPALQDARTRIVPVLENKEMAIRIGTQLQNLADNLAARDVVRSRHHVNQAVMVLDRYMNSPNAVATDIPEVGAIQLVLYHAGVLLRMQIDPALLPYIGGVTSSVDP